MFGRYELPLWRKVLGVALVLVFVWNFNILANQFIRDNFTNGGWNNAWPGEHDARARIR